MAQPGHIEGGEPQAAHGAAQPEEPEAVPQQSEDAARAPEEDAQEPADAGVAQEEERQPQQDGGDARAQGEEEEDAQEPADAGVAQEEERQPQAAEDDDVLELCDLVCSLLALHLMRDFRASVLLLGVA